jgi:hypothetical protein
MICVLNLSEVITGSGKKSSGFTKMRYVAIVVVKIENATSPTLMPQASIVRSNCLDSNPDNRGCSKLANLVFYCLKNLAK